MESFGFIGVGELTHIVVSAPDTQDGGTVDITAQVTPGSGNGIVPGSVVFRDDGIEVGTADLANGVAIVAHTFNGGRDSYGQRRISGTTESTSCPASTPPRYRSPAGATTTTLSGPIYIPVNSLRHVPCQNPISYRRSGWKHHLQGRKRPAGSGRTRQRFRQHYPDAQRRERTRSPQPTRASSAGSTSSPLAVTVGNGFLLKTVTPCRLVDTRTTGGPIAAGTARDFAVPQLGGCNIPNTAVAYSLNVTAVPSGRLGFLTAWPTGQPQPVVSLLELAGWPHQG